MDNLIFTRFHTPQFVQKTDWELSKSNIIKSIQEALLRYEKTEDEREQELIKTYLYYLYSLGQDYDLEKSKEEKTIKDLLNNIGINGKTILIPEILLNDENFKRKLDSLIQQNNYCS